MTRRILLALAFAATLAAQTFIQMTDPQFGMYTGNKGFAQETANFEFAVATANRLKPAFVVLTGDLVNAAGDAAQIAEFKRVAARLDPNIRLFLMPGNHDVGNEPTKESLAKYREQFGPDYYTFRMGDITGIVLNSSLEKDPHNVPEEAAKMEAWFRSELAKAQPRVIVFQHIPFFLNAANEEDRYENIPRETRQHYLKMLHEYGVKQVFAGHYHSTSEARDGDLEMITTGPVGKPVPPAKSGLRIVTVSATGVTHKYYDFGELP
jgi:DNA repair exonuclease SbcCD nuclease subunit